MQNQHQTLPLFSFAMYPDETRRYVQLDELINSGVSRTFIPTNKAHKRHCVSEQRGRTQSQGLTDEFMCALINWFTQRLSHVDITLVQGLIVDFCYDKLLTEDWKRRYRFSFALRKNSLVGYDSLMKNSPKKTKLRLSYENFGSEKFAAFFLLSLIRFRLPWGMTSFAPPLSSLVSDSAAIDHTLRDSSRARAFRVGKFKLCRLSALLFIEQN